MTPDPSITDNTDEYMDNSQLLDELQQLRDIQDRQNEIIDRYERLNNADKKLLSGHNLLLIAALFIIILLIAVIALGSLDRLPYFTNSSGNTVNSPGKTPNYTNNTVYTLNVSAFNPVVYSLNGTGIYVNDYGAHGNGVDDDTAAINDAISVAVASGVNKIEFTPGAMYNIEAGRIIIPNVNFIIEGNEATLTVVGSPGDYALGSYNYVNNAINVGYQLEIRDLVINGDNLAANGIAIENWNAIIYNCELYQCTNAGLKVTTQGISGSNLISSTEVNNKYILNSIHDNGNYGLYIQDSSQHKATDYFMQDNLIYNNPKGFYADTCAGAYINGNHWYEQSIGDMYLAISSFGLRITDNEFEDEDSVEIQQSNPNVTAILEGNQIAGKVSFTANGIPNATLLSSGNKYYMENGHSGYIYFPWCDASNIIESIGDTFESATPYVPGNEAQPNLIYSTMCWDEALKTYLNGQQSGDNWLHCYDYGTAPPSTGHVGDYCQNTAPRVQGSAGSQYIIQGWICTSNTPTWSQVKTFTGT